MEFLPGSLSRSFFNDGLFYYCSFKEAIDVDGDEKKAKMFLGLIKEKYKTKEEREYLRALLTKEQWSDLKRLVEIYKTGQIKQEAFVYKHQTQSYQKTELSLKEKFLADLILKDKRPLERELGPIDDVLLEADYRPFGKCDVRVIANRVCYPIELKDETANERISGQIRKYIKGAILQIKYGRYDTVQGVTIAPNYTKEALMQLKALNVWSYSLTIDKKSYFLERLI